MANIVFNRTRIIHASTLFAQSRHFNAGMLDAAKSQSRAIAGKALVVVHPLFMRDYCLNDSHERFNPILFRQIAINDYDVYLGNLEKCLINDDKLTFVLAEERSFDNIRNWLIRLKINRDIFILPTELKNPTPKLNINIGKTAWQIFADILKAAGVFQVSLAGELAYIDRAKAIGCVFVALNALSPFLPVEVIHPMTFPGTD